MVGLPQMKPKKLKQILRNERHQFMVDFKNQIEQHVRPKPQWMPYFVWAKLIRWFFKSQP